MKRNKEQQEKTAQLIREKRRELDMQQQELARKAYISKSDMCKIEKAQKWVESDELRRIADALGVETGYLLGTLKHETREKTDVAEVLSLDSDAIDLLLELKNSSSKESQYVSDFISFFIKALYSDDGLSLVSALAELSYLYMQNSLFENKDLKDLLSNEQRFLRTNIAASKEEMREAATKIFVEFCQNRPFGSSTQQETDNHRKEGDDNGNV